jgi:phage tail-like protein
MEVNDKLRLEAIPAFRFVVTIDRRPQAAFTECTLPTIEWEIEEVKEGGLNTFVHQLPGRRKAAKVTLKNGVAKSELFGWYQALMSESFSRKDVSIALLDLRCDPILVWELKQAYPVKWMGPQLKSDGNTIAIQTLELAGDEVTVT